MKKIIIGAMAVVAILGLAACEEKKPVENNEESVVHNEENNVVEDMGGYAGSNIPLKDNLPEAEYQIKVAMQYLLEEAYGNEVVDARVEVERMYSAEEEKADPTLNEYHLGANEVAFEVKYELKPAEGVEDVNKFTAATGEYDEETGWITEKYNVGILRPNPDTESEQEYIITNFGTAF